MRKNVFKKDLLALLQRKFFHVYISNHMIFLVQSEITGGFQKAEIAFTKAAHAISAF